MATKYKDTLDPKEPEAIRSNIDDDVVKAALKLIANNEYDRTKRASAYDKIQDLIEQGFEVREPVGPRKISSKTIQQAIQKVVNRMKFLDFQVHGSGRPESREKIVTAAVSTVATNGGLMRSLRDKGGVFQGAVTFGDKMIMVGTSEDKGIPITFSAVSAENIYVDSFATIMRGTRGQAVSKMVVIFSMSWADACLEYPRLKEIGGKGRIPREQYQGKDFERTFEQSSALEEDVIEIAYFYDIANKCYAIFAGRNCTILKTMKGDSYPFVMDDKPYIPVSHFFCIPSVEGFWNYGIGHMLYDLAVVSRQLLNQGLAHAEDSTYPITLVNMPQSEAANFFNKLLLAHEMRAQGKKGYVPMPYDPTNPNSSGVSAQSLTTQNLMQEWQLIFDRLDREISRLGINLDDADRGETMTATQIMAEEENATAFVKQIMEYNASECEFLIELILDFIKKFVTKVNKTPLNLTTMIEEEGMAIRADNITLGAVADELKMFNYFVEINSRSGSIPSNIMEQAQVARMLQVAPPGTPAYFQLIQQLGGLNNRDIPIESYMASQAGGESPTPEEATIPTETDRIKVDPYESEPVMA